MLYVIWSCARGTKLTYQVSFLNHCATPVEQKGKDGKKWIICGKAQLDGSCELVMNTHSSDLKPEDLKVTATN